MAIVIACSDRDDGEAGTNQSEQRDQPGVLGAMVGHLQDLGGPRAKRQRHIGFRVRREERVDAPVGDEEDDRVLIRILARGAGVLRPEHVHAKTTELEPRAGACKNHADVVSGRAGPRGALVGAVRREARVKEKTYGNLVEHGCSASDVVALRMGQHHCGETAHAEAAKLFFHVSLGRPLVDEHGSLRNLDERRVTLTDVEEGDPQTRRPRANVVGAERPAGEPQGQESREDRAVPDAGRRMPEEKSREPNRSDQGCERLPRCHLGVRQVAEEPRHSGEIGGEPTVHPGKRGRGSGQDRVENRANEGQAQERGDDRGGQRVARHRVERDLAELDHQDRGSDGAAGGRNGEHRNKARRHGVAVEPCLQPRH